MRLRWKLGSGGLVVAFAAVLAVGVTHAAPSTANAGNVNVTAVRNGPLTLVGQGPPGPGTVDGAIATVGPDGTPHLLYRPPGCCEIFGLAWSPNGKRLAYSLTCVGCGPQAQSTFGLHVVDLGTGSDRRIRPREDGFDVDWSRKRSRIAYVISRLFARPLGTIYVTSPDGSGVRRLHTGTAGWDTSPSWSPAGTRLAFASKNRNCAIDAPCAPAAYSVSIVDASGKHRRLVTRRATAPAWSPDGRRIAVRSTDCNGLRLLTPRGKDVTPAPRRSGCRVIGVGGAPTWSPNGRQIAIQTKKGVYVMSADGSGLRLVTRQTGGGAFGTGQLAWRPIFR